MRPVIVVYAVLAVAVVGGSALLVPHLGVDGAGIAWLVRPDRRRRRPARHRAPGRGHRRAADPAPAGPRLARAPSGGPTPSASGPGTDRRAAVRPPRWAGSVHGGPRHARPGRRPGRRHPAPHPQAPRQRGRRRGPGPRAARPRGADQRPGPRRLGRPGAAPDPGRRARRRPVVARDRGRGHPVETALGRGLRPDVVLRDGAAALRGLHEPTRVPIDAASDALLATWIDDPLADRRPGLPRRPGHARPSWTSPCGTALAGRPLVVAWSHGDLTPGNLFVDDDGRIGGMVDWEGARADRLPEVDLLTLVIAVRAADGPREFGEVVRDLLDRPWSEEEVAVRDAGPNRDVPRDALVLLAWLHHVATNLAKSDAYTGHDVWLLRNVRDVLGALALRATCPSRSRTPSPNRSTSLHRLPVADRRPGRRRTRAVDRPGLRSCGRRRGLWWLALRSADLRQLTDIGLVSLIPPLGYVALAVLVTGFAVTVHRRPLHEGAVAAHVVALGAVIWSGPRRWSTGPSATRGPGSTSGSSTTSTGSARWIPASTSCPCTTTGPASSPAATCSSDWSGPRTPSRSPAGSRWSWAWRRWPPSCSLAATFTSDRRVVCAHRLALPAGELGRPGVLLAPGLRLPPLPRRPRPRRPRRPVAPAPSGGDPGRGPAGRGHRVEPPADAGDADRRPPRPRRHPTGPAPAARPRGRRLPPRPGPSGRASRFVGENLVDVIEGFGRRWPTPRGT